MSLLRSIRNKTRFLPLVPLGRFITMSSTKEKDSPDKLEKQKDKMSKKADTDSKKEIKEKEDAADKKTRSKVQKAEENYRDKYLRMPLEEKRKFYKCGSKFVTLDQVEAWTVYAERIIKKYKKSEREPEFPVDEILNMKISLWRGDITSLEIDAIVNAANTTLLGGGGVDGAIHSAAGAKLKDESGRLGGCSTGDAKITGGYKLPAKYVIHTVGPIGEKPDKLESAYRRSLEVAKENNVRTLAFPCISTGVYGYEVENATPVALRTVRNWLLKGDNSQYIDKVIFCVFLAKDVKVYENCLLQYFPIPEPPDNGTNDSENGSPKRPVKADNHKKTSSEKVEETANNVSKDSTNVSTGKTDKTDVVKSETESSMEVDNLEKENSEGTGKIDNDTKAKSKKTADKAEKKGFKSPVKPTLTPMSADKKSATIGEDESSPAAKKRPPSKEEKKEDTSELMQTDTVQTSHL